MRAPGNYLSFVKTAELCLFHVGVALLASLLVAFSFAPYALGQAPAKVSRILYGVAFTTQRDTLQIDICAADVLHIRARPNPTTAETSPSHARSGVVFAAVSRADNSAKAKGLTM